MPSEHILHVLFLLFRGVGGVSCFQRLSTIAVLDRIELFGHSTARKIAITDYPGGYVPFLIDICFPLTHDVSSIKIFFESLLQKLWMLDSLLQEQAVFLVVVRTKFGLLETRRRKAEYLLRGDGDWAGRRKVKIGRTAMFYTESDALLQEDYHTHTPDPEKHYFY